MFLFLHPQDAQFPPPVIHNIRQYLKELFVRLDGQLGKSDKDISHPVFSPDGSALAYAVRGSGGSFFVINEREGPKFEEVLPDMFAFSNDGKRHAYLAKKSGRLVALVDGVSQSEGTGDLVPRRQPPVFSADGGCVGYLESSDRRRKMRVVINGQAGELFDGVDTRSLRFSPVGKRFSYAANDRSAGNRWFYVVDGQQRKTFDALGVSFAFSPDGRRIAYTGRRGRQSILVVDGESEVPIEGIVDHTLAFSPDGRRLAYAVAKPDGRCYLVVDGKLGTVHNSILGVSAALGGLALNQSSMHTGYGLGSFYIPSCSVRTAAESLMLHALIECRTFMSTVWTAA